MSEFNFNPDAISQEPSELERDDVRVALERFSLAPTLLFCWLMCPDLLLSSHMVMLFEVLIWLRKKHITIYRDAGKQYICAKSPNSSHEGEFIQICRRYMERKPFTFSHQKRRSDDSVRNIVDCPLKP